MSVDQPTPEPTPEPVPGEGPGGDPTTVLEPARMRELHALAAAGEATAPAASGPPDERRRRRGLVPAAFVALLVLLLAMAGLAVLPRVTGTDLGEGSGRASGPSDDEGPEGGEMDLTVDPPGTLPGFALGDEAGEEAFLDDILIDREWPGGRGPVGPPGVDQPDASPPDGVVPPDPGGGEVGDGVDPQDQGDGDDQGDQGEPPAPDPEPVDPCAGLAAGAHLVTTPDPSTLPIGVMVSSLTIRNCGSDPVSWTAATKPSVTLDAAEGTLAPHATQALGFTIDASRFGDDAITFRIKVSETGFNQYIDINATKAGLAAPDPAPDPNGSVTDGGPTGCAAQCITTAWLTPNASTANVDIAVESTTAARFDVFVSTSAPVADGEGHPSFPEVGRIAATADLNTAWHALLSPLEPATDYHIVVQATDGAGGIAHRVGTFRTVTPAIDPGRDEAAPGGDSGCSTQCITKAWLTPDTVSFDMDLEVTAHTLARFEVYVSTASPEVDDAGNPVFPGAAPMATNDAYESSWSTTLTPLEPGTRYTVIVKATDGMLRPSFQVGSFETRHGAEQMLVTFHQIRVHGDGDEHGRGELTFLAEVADELVFSTGERRIGSDTTIHLDDGDRGVGISWVTDYDESPGAFLPLVSAVGIERDPTTNGFCSEGDNVHDSPNRSDDCNWASNVVGSGLISTAGLASLDRCPALGIDDEGFEDDACMVLESPPGGGDVPSFSLTISFRPLTV